MSQQLSKDLGNPKKGKYGRGNKNKTSLKIEETSQTSREVTKDKTVDNEGDMSEMRAKSDKSYEQNKIETPIKISISSADKKED